MSARVLAALARPSRLLDLERLLLAARGGRRAVMDLLFPPACAMCGAALVDKLRRVELCETCQAHLAGGEGAYCRRCGAGLMEAADQWLPCQQCRRRRYHFDGVVRMGTYRDHLREAVLRMKRTAGTPLAAAVGDLFAECRGASLAELGADFVIPVPMHWWRRALRGTNSPQVVAERIASRLGVLARPGAVVRHRNTLPQGDLTRRRRRANVRAAFRVRRGYHFKGASVVVVDDILTTGATCNEVARVLKNAGAARVVVAVIARADAPD